MKLTWMKLDVGILDDSKIKLIRKMPDGDSLFVLWVGVMCLAMRSTVPGMLYIAENVPYQSDDLAEILELNVKTVQLGLKAFQRYGMIQIVDGVIEVAKLREHQSLDQIENQRELNRERVRRFRERRAIEQEQGKMGVTHYSVTSNDIDKNQIRIDSDKESESERRGVSTAVVKKPRFDASAMPLPFSSENFATVWGQWVQHRIEIKKPLTETSARMLLKKLEGWGEARAISALVVSLEGGWQGVFEPKEFGKRAPAQPSEGMAKPGAMDGLFKRGGGAK